MPYGHLRHLIEHYVAPHPARELRALFVSRLFLNFSAGCVALFQAVYLYRNGFSVPVIIGLYTAAYVIYLFGLPLAARICRRHGYEHTMLLSAPFLIIHDLAFLFVPSWPFLGAALMVLGLAAYKLLYWPSFHACFASWCRVEEDGREISNLDVMGTLVRIAGPAIGGAIATWFGFPALFVFAMVLVCLSYLPLLRIPTVIIPVPFPYFAAWRRLFDRRTWRLAVGTASFGTDIVMTAVWSIFVTVTITGIAVVGLLASLAEAANTLVILEAGRRADENRGGRRAMFRIGALGAAMTFLTRGFLSSVLGVFAVNLFHNLSTHLLAVPYTAEVYENAKRGDIMERVVFMEMALGLGRIAMGVAAMAILWFFPGAWSAVFIVAAALSASAFLLPFKKN